jgi:hypothetical protein
MLLSKKLVGTTAACIAAAVAASAAPAQADLYTVTTTNDTGKHSLRRAIRKANAHPGPDTIKFAIPTSAVNPLPHTIAPLSNLPTITQRVTIDGYSEPGTLPATRTAAAVLGIAIDASSVDRGLKLRTNRSVVRGLIVHSAQTDDGIRVLGNRNRVEGSYLGTNGTDRLGNNDAGVEITGDRNLVGGKRRKSRNVLSDNDGEGVEVFSGTGNRIEGNLIGTDAAGTGRLGNHDGVQITGDETVVHRNVIADSSIFNVSLFGDRNSVKGNAIGTDVTRTQDFGSGDGVQIDGHDNRVGGRTRAARNVISGNTTAVDIQTGDGNTIQGNLIGPDGTGNSALAGAAGISNGVQVESADNLVANNVIAGNNGVGVELVAGPNTVQDNMIGTTADGTAPLPNESEGVLVSADDNLVEGNVIAASQDDGVLLTASRNRVVGNTIGGASVDFGNLGDGVHVDGGDENEIGSTAAEDSNTVTFNGGDGVRVEAGINNTILRNSISDNVGLGIDLDPDDVTANDGADGDAGPNGLLNFPDVTAATAAGGVTTVDWEIANGLPGTTFRIEFYANTACDGSGNGEGQRFLGADVGRTDVNGDVAGTVITPNQAAVGELVTATATVERIVFFPFDVFLDATSEFSVCEPVV